MLVGLPAKADSLAVNRGSPEASISWERVFGMDENVLREISASWRGARYPVVLTGAGISTESGVPDFRSSKGLWRQTPEELSSITMLERKPELFYPFYQDRIRNILAAGPNAGHFGLSRLMEHGYLRVLITQNIDGYHQLAGAPEVLELHGTLRKVSCMGCHAAFDSRRMLPEAEAETLTPGVGPECQCPECGGRLRPDIVLFGEGLPERAWEKAMRAARRADLFVVVGSSLTVGPANLLPEWAADAGARLLIINREATPLDRLARWVVRESAGAVISALVDSILAEPV